MWPTCVKMKMYLKQVGLDLAALHLAGLILGAALTVVILLERRLVALLLILQQGLLLLLGRVPRFLLVEDRLHRQMTLQLRGPELTAWLELSAGYQIHERWEANCWMGPLSQLGQELG